MPNDDRLYDLLDTYRDRLARGGEVTPADLGVDADTFAAVAQLHRRSQAVERRLAPVRVPDVRPGVTTDRYQTARLLGSGGYGDVFHTDDRELGRAVALKVPRVLRTAAEDVNARLRAEAVLMGQLDHPGIPAVHSLGTDRTGRPFYTMRLIDGTTLADATDRLHLALPPKLSAREFGDRLRPLLRRFVAICAAVAYAHSRGVIHRDLKPHNVMLGAFDETLVMDWGLARAVRSAGGGEESVITAGLPAGQTAGAVGTIGYIAPEQWAADPGIDHRADVYSLGAILYHLLAGRPSLLQAEIGEGFRAEKVRPLRGLKSELPPALVAVCEKAMSADRADRYASAEDLSADVQAWLDDGPVGAYREPWVDRVARWTRRHRTAVSIAATAVPLLVALGVGAWLANGIVRTAETQRAAAVSQKDAAELEAQHVEERRRLAAEQADTYRDVASQNTTAFVSAAQALRNNRTVNVTALEQVFAAAVSATDRLLEKSGRRPEVLADKARLLAEFSELFAIDAGATARGERTADEAVGLIEEALKTDAERPDWLAVRAQAFSARAIARSNAGDVGGATRDRREALATATKLTQLRPDDTRGWAELARATGGTGYDFSNAGDPFTAEAWFRQALELWRKMGGDPTDQENARRMANTERLLGVCLMECGDQTEADTLLKSADERMRPFDAKILTTKRFEQNRLYVWFAQINRLVSLVQAKPSLRGELIALGGKAERHIDTLLAADPLNAEWKLGKARCRFLYANVSPAVTPAERKALLDILVELVPLTTKAAAADPTNLSRRLDVLGVRQFLLWGRLSAGGHDQKVMATEANDLAADADEVFRQYPWNVVALSGVEMSHELARTLTRGDAAAAHGKAFQTALSVWAEARLKTDPMDPAAHRQLAESIEKRTFSISDEVEQVANCRLAVTHWDAVVAARPNSPRWALARAEAIDTWRIVASRSFQARRIAERYAEEVAALREYNRAADDLVKTFPRLPAAYQQLRHARQELAAAIRTELKPFDLLRKEFRDSEVVFAEAMNAWEKEAELLPQAEAARSPFVGRGELWVGTFQTDPLLKKVKDANRQVIANRLTDHRLNQFASDGQKLFEAVVGLVRALPDDDPEAITALADAVAVADDLRRLKKLHPFQERLNGFILAELGRRCGPSSAAGGPAATAVQLAAATERLKGKPR